MYTTQGKPSENKQKRRKLKWYHTESQRQEQRLGEQTGTNGTTFEEIDSIEYEEDYIDDDALFEDEYTAWAEFEWECETGR